MPDERMPRLSAISEIRDFFEVFLPGFFLLLHIALLAYCAVPASARVVFNAWLPGNLWAAAAFIGLPVGYVLGLALRLGRTSYADSVSGRLVRFTSGRKLISAAEGWWGPELVHGYFRLAKSIIQEGIPYPGLIMQRVAVNLPTEARIFYESLWITQTRGEVPRVVKIDLLRFNFFKTLVASLDDRAARDMFAFEMRVRHAAHTCYALFCLASSSFSVRSCRLDSLG